MQQMDFFSIFWCTNIQLSRGQFLFYQFSLLSLFKISYFSHSTFLCELVSRYLLIRRFIPIFFLFPFFIWFEEPPHRVHSINFCGMSQVLLFTINKCWLVRDGVVTWVKYRSEKMIGSFLKLNISKFVGSTNVIHHFLIDSIFSYKFVSSILLVIEVLWN